MMKFEQSKNFGIASCLAGRQASSRTARKWRGSRSQRQRDGNEKSGYKETMEWDYKTGGR